MTNLVPRDIGAGYGLPSHKSCPSWYITNCWRAKKSGSSGICSKSLNLSFRGTRNLSFCCRKEIPRSSEWHTCPAKSEIFSPDVGRVRRFWRSRSPGKRREQIAEEPKKVGSLSFWGEATAWHPIRFWRHRLLYDPNWFGRTRFLAEHGMSNGCDPQFEESHNFLILFN